MAISRLQFRHLSTPFNTREEAYGFLDSIVNSSDVKSQKFVESLIGEPLVVKYKDNVSDKEHVILAIGTSGEMGEGVLDVKYHYIDTANIEKDVENLYEEANDFQEKIKNIIESAGFNEDGTYSSVEKGDYIGKAKNIKAATRLLDKALSELQAEVDKTQVGAGLNEDGSYTAPLNLVADPIEYINSATSLYDADKLLDKAIQALKKDSIKNVVINDGKENLHVEKSNGVVVDRVAYLDVNTSNLNLPSDYEAKYQDVEKEHHQLHDNMQLSEALAQLEANFHLATGATAGIHIEKIPQNELESNVREGFKLVSADGTEASDSARIFIYKDASFVGAKLGHIGASVNEVTGEITDGTGADALILEYINYEGKYVIAAIDLGSFLRESEFKDGLDVNGVGEVRVKVDETSEKYLTVSPMGVKIDGIDLAIYNAVNEEKNRAEDAESKLDNKLNTVITGSGLNADGTYKKPLAQDALKYINESESINDATHRLDKALQEEENRATLAESALQSEIDAVEKGVGLNGNGEYKANEDTNFISAATSVVNATEILDREVKTLDEKIDKIAGERELVYDGIVKGAGLIYNEAGAVVYNKHDKVGDDVEFISDAESIDDATVKLDKALQNERERSTEKEESLQAELDNTQVGAGLESDGSYVADDSANYINNATSLKDADSKLDSSLKNEVDRAIDAEGEIKTELDNTQIGAGLNEDGSYKQHNTVEEGLKYITGATSIDNATVKLDEGLQSVNDKFESVTDTIEASIGLTEDGKYVNNKTPKHYIEGNTIVGDINKIDDALKSEEVERKSEDEKIQSELDKTQVGAGLNEDGSYPANTSSNYIVEAKSLTDADNKLDAALKSEVDRAIAAENYISGEVATLSATVISNAVKSTGKTINVDVRPDFTNIEVNVDNVTLKSDADGKIYSTLKIQEVTTTEENVLKSYELWDADKNVLGSRINVYKDQTLKNVELKGQSLEFTYILADGSEKTVSVDMSKFLYEGEFKDGLMTEDGVVKIKLADNNENEFLGVSESGLRLHGVQNAIDAAKASATTVVTGNMLTHIEIAEQTASDGHKVFVITENNIANDDELKSEIERAKAAENSISGDVTTLSGSVIAMDKSHTVSSSDNSIIVSKTTDGTDVYVNVDGKSIVKDGATGTLSTDLKVKKTVDADNREVHARYTLVDNTDAQKGEIIEIPNSVKEVKSAYIADVEGAQTFIITTKLDNNQEEIISSDASKIVAESDLKNGFMVVHETGVTQDGRTVERGFVHVKVSEDSEPYFFVKENGVGVTGITNAINEVKVSSKVEVEKGTGTDHVTVTTKANEDGHVTYVINDSDIASETALNAEIERAKGEESAIEAALSELEKSVDENKKALTIKSTGNTINVSKDETGTNVEVNIDNSTIKASADGKIGTTLTLSSVTPSDGTIREEYTLVDGDGNDKSERTHIKIYKDSSFVHAQLGHSGATVNEDTGIITDGDGQDVLIMEYISNEGKYQIVQIPLGDFLRQAHFKNGLQVDENGEVSIKISSDNENKFLTVDETGLKLNGVQTAIDAAKASATTVVTGNQLTHITVSETTASDGHKVYILEESNIASNTDLTVEVERAKAKEASIDEEIADIKKDIKKTTITSADKTINVSETTDGTDVSINIDNTTLVKDINGVLSNGIKIKELGSTEIADDNIWRSFKLTDANGNYLFNSVEIQVPKTRTIKKIDVIEKESVQYLRCEYEVLGESTTYTVDFDINELIAENDIADGLTVDNHKVKVKVDPESDSFVTVTESGIRIKGITDAINKAKTVVRKGTESDHVTVDSEIAPDGHMIYTINDKDIASATALTEEINTRKSDIEEAKGRLDNVEKSIEDIEESIEGLDESVKNLEDELNNSDSGLNKRFDDLETELENLQDSLDNTNKGAGLDKDGNYNPKTGNTFTSGSTSLSDAIDDLDGALKDVNDKVNNIEEQIGLDENGEFHPDSDNTYTSGSTTVKDAIDALDKALSEEIGDDETGGLKKRIKELEDRVAELEDAKTNIKNTIFDALTEMLVGTSREIKLTIDEDAKTITIGYSDDAIFGNIIQTI